MIVYYKDALEELTNSADDIAKFVKYLGKLGFDHNNREKYDAKNNMILMTELFSRHLRNLHKEAVVCRQRKKTTLAFKRAYRRTIEYRDVVENNRVMFMLMFA